MRFEGYTEALFESQLVDANARAEQKRRLGKNNALNVVYSYLVEMYAANKTAMLQVREHATILCHSLENATVEIHARAFK